MFIDDLKKSILQKAIQGELVEQNPNDEPASELLKKIKEEKEKLIEDGKIKKEKALAPITDEEKLFDIPASWERVKIWNLLSVVSDGTHKTPSYTEEWVPFLSVQNISKWFFDLSKIKYISPEEHHKLIQRIKPQLNDIFFCRIWTLWKAIKNTLDFEFSIFVSLGLLRSVITEIVDYIVLVINSPLWDERIQKNKVWWGTHTYKINLVDIPNMLIPLPPLEEQKRIVAKLDELMPLLDEARPLEEEITKLEKDFPSKLRQSILQYAIQWKLVEQNSTDEPANELLSKIKEEKGRLIKEWKIKKEKPLAPITDEEKSFEIPRNWEWVRLGEIWTILWGKRIPAWRSLSQEDTGYKYIRVSDMKNNTVSLDNIQYVPEDIYPLISRYIINKEDVYITVAWTIWRVWKIPAELDWANLTENADRIVINNIHQDWLIYCLDSNVVQSQITACTTQVWQPKLAIKRIQDLIIPLPPLEEQRRIVAKLDELLELCDNLEGVVNLS